MRHCWLALPAVFVTAAAGAAAQEWVGLGESELGTYYFDPDSVRADGHRRRVWRLIDRKEKLPPGIQSGKALLEIDCGGGTYRYVRTLHYSGRMGTGKYLHGDGEQPDAPIGPGTMVAYLARVVC